MRLCIYCGISTYDKLVINDNGVNRCLNSRCIQKHLIPKFAKAMHDNLNKHPQRLADGWRNYSGPVDTEQAQCVNAVHSIMFVTI